MNRRPLGATIIGVASVLFYGYWSYITLTWIWMMVIAPEKFVLPNNSRAPFDFSVIWFRAIPAFAGLIGAIGVLMVRNWGRWLFLIVAGFWTTYWGVKWICGDLYELETVVGPAAVVVGASVIGYFLRPGMKAQFVRSSKQQ